MRFRIARTWPTDIQYKCRPRSLGNTHITSGWQAVDQHPEISRIQAPQSHCCTSDQRSCIRIGRPGAGIWRQHCGNITPCCDYRGDHLLGVSFDFIKNGKTENTPSVRMTPASVPSLVPQTRAPRHMPSNDENKSTTSPTITLTIKIIVRFLKMVYTGILRYCYTHPFCVSTHYEWTSAWEKAHTKLLDPV